MPTTDPTTSESPTPAQKQPPPAPKISSEQILRILRLLDMGNLIQMIRKWSCAAQFPTVCLLIKLTFVLFYHFYAKSCCVIDYLMTISVQTNKIVAYLTCLVRILGSNEYSRRVLTH